VAGATEAAGAAVTFGLPMNAARSAISAELNLPLYREPMPPLLAAKAELITDGLLAAARMPLTLLAGLAP
jgi:hypothetical protein